MASDGSINTTGTHGSISHENNSQKSMKLSYASYFFIYLTSSLTHTNRKKKIDQPVKLIGLE